MQRVGVIQYLNSLPLIAPYLLNALPTPFEWIRDTPAKLNQMVLEKTLPISFVSSLFYLEHTDQLDLIPGMGIGADGPVGSVSLFYPAHVTHFNGVTIALDPESATSNGLLKWYMEKIRRETPRYSHDPAPQSTFLLIGDKCLSQRTKEGFKKIDLAEEWKSYTNLPLPFAVLVAQKGVPEEVKNELLFHLRAGLQWSQNHYDQVAAIAKDESPLSKEELITYWKQLHFIFDDRFETALGHLQRDVLKRIYG